MPTPEPVSLARTTRTVFLSLFSFLVLTGGKHEDFCFPFVVFCVRWMCM